MILTTTLIINLPDGHLIYRNVSIVLRDLQVQSYRNVWSNSKYAESFFVDNVKKYEDLSDTKKAEDLSDNRCKCTIPCSQWIPGAHHIKIVLYATRGAVLTTIFAEL